MLKASDVTVLPIGFLEHQAPSSRADQRMRLEQMARTTGGQRTSPYSAEQLESVYDKIVEELAARYTLGYLSTNERADGHWRDVKIRVKRPDLKDFKIRDPIRLLVGALSRIQQVANPFEPPPRPPPPPHPTTASCPAPPPPTPPPPPLRVRARRASARAIGREHVRAARRHRLRQDVHDGAGHRAGEPADAGDGRTTRRWRRSSIRSSGASSPRTRSSTSSATTTTTSPRPTSRRPTLHREGSDDQRRDRSHAAVGDAVALRAPRRHHRRQRVVHLRPRLARGLLRDDAAARARPADRPRADPAQAGRDPVRAQRPRVRARRLPRPRRHRRGLSRRTRTRRCGSSCSATRSTSWSRSIR